jgi:protein ImuB
VLIAETAHGPRIEAVTGAGLAAGARPGMRLGAARAVCPGLKTAPSDPAGDRAFLDSLALWAQRWGPWSALDGPDGLLVDVGAVGHLFGGEARLLADAEAAFARRGLTARLAIAPTAGAAWALAHFGPDKAILSLRDGEDMPAMLADLPVAALRLEDAVLTVLRRLGLKRIGQLRGIGRDALHRRFRCAMPEANPLVRLDQLLGRVAEPLLPVVARPDPWVQRRLVEPIRHRALFDRVLVDLAAAIAGELEDKALGVRRLELGLWRVDGAVIVRRLEFAAATRDPAHIVRLFAGKLDAIEAGFGIELLRLRAPWTEPLALAQGDFAAAPAQGTSLAECIDRLTARLGERAVRRPVAHASHVPERAQRWQAPLAPEPANQGELLFHQRPLKLLDRPEAIAVLYATPDGFPRRFRWRGQVHEVARVEGPERIAPEWWREKSTVRLRDYYRIEDGEGRRYWIYRYGLDGDGRGGAPEWFLQGLCG